MVSLPVDLALFVLLGRDVASGLGRCTTRSTVAQGDMREPRRQPEVDTETKTDDDNGSECSRLVLEQQTSETSMVQLKRASVE